MHTRTYIYINVSPTCVLACDHSSLTLEKVRVLVEADRLVNLVNRTDGLISNQAF